MRAIVCGANGAMGKLICDIFGDEVVGKVSIDGEHGVARTFSELGEVAADVVVDFSHHTAIADVLNYTRKIGSAAVIGTTGHTEEEKALIRAASQEMPVFYAGNVSLGIAVLCRLVKQAASYFPEADIEIVEIHHTRKVDAPSGTALMLADAIRSVRPEAYNNCGRSGQGKREHSEIGIHSIRMGNIVGEHEVIIGTQNQTITLKHEAHNRALFAEGALAAAEFIIGMNPGLYSMPDMISHSGVTEDAVFEAK